MNYSEKILLRHVTFIASLAASVLGCGSVTPLAADGSGGEGGRVTLSTGGVSGESGESGGLAGAGSAPSTGGAIGTGGTGGVDPPDASGGGSGGATGIDAGAGGATVFIVDAGATDGSACPSKLDTSFPGIPGYPTSLGGTSTGFTMGAGTSSGGGPTGRDPVMALTADLVPAPNSSNPPAGSTGSFELPISENCYGDSFTNDDLSLQGYTFSFWLNLQGACDLVSAGELGWKVGLVTGSGVTFPWKEQTSAVPVAACTSGASVKWTAFGTGMRAHALIIEFIDLSGSTGFSGYIDISDEALTFN